MPKHTFESILKPGNVIKGFVKYPDGGKSVKMLIILSYDNSKQIITCAATSNIDGHDNPYRQHDIYIPKGEEDIFKKNTYIEMSRTFSFSFSELSDSYDKKKFKFRGSISEDTLDRIYDGVKSTPHLNEYTKEQILVDDN